MSRHTLLDLLGTEKLPAQAERQFIEFCLWQQARPAIVQILRETGLDAYAEEAAGVKTPAALAACVHRAAKVAQSAKLPIMAFATVQGAATDTEQLAAAAHPDTDDPEAASFHAARLAGWATWAANQFQNGTLKTTAENVAYGAQLKMLMNLLGVKNG